LFDDIPNIVQNPLLRINGATFEEWRIASLSGGAGLFGRPIALFSFAAQHAALGGLSPAAVKLVNLAAHLTAGFLVFLFSAECLRLFLDSDRRAAALAGTAAILWVLHPLHVSTVLYAVQRMAILSGLFMVLALWLYARFRIRCSKGIATEGELVGVILWILTLTILASLCKENGVLLPLLVGVCEVFLFRHIAYPEISRIIRRILFTISACLFFAVVWAIMHYLPGFLNGYALRSFTLEERLLTQARVLWLYLSWLAFPRLNALGLFHDDIAISQSWLEPRATLIACVAWFVMVAAALALRFRAPLLAFAVAFFLLAHSLESTILPLEIAFEHRNYMPSIAVVPLLAVSLNKLSNIASPRVTRLIVIGVCSILLLQTGLRAHQWRSELSLLLAGSQYHPLSVRSHIGAALSLLDASVEANRADNDEARTSVLPLAKKHIQAARALPQGDLLAPATALLAAGRFGLTSFDTNQLWNEVFAALRGSPVQAIEWAVLQRLLGCLGTASGVCDPERIERMAALAFELNPRRIEAWRLQQNWLALSAADLDDQLAHLEATLDRWPAHPATRVEHVALLARVGAIGAAYSSLGAWLANDQDRSYLALMSALIESKPGR
jgi:hypothetical protein